MGATITEKILSAHCGKETVKPGEMIYAKVDYLFSNEINSAMSVKDFARLDNPRIFDKERIVIVPDHYTPNKDIKSAAMQAGA